MAALITPEELIVFLNLPDDTQPTDRATLLCALVQGLVADEIGEHDPWPLLAKNIAFSSASRAYVNPDGVRMEVVGGTTVSYNSPLYTNGVFLSEDELARLRRWRANFDGTGLPTFEFPGTWPYPDPVERTATAVTG